MRITETSADGLKREFKVVVPAQDIQDKRDRRLKEIGQTLKMPGFRPGKVPMPILKQRFGQSVMGEVLEQAVNESSAKAMQEAGIRPALQPKIEIVSFDDGQDLEFKMAIEQLPDIELGDFSDIKLTREVVEVGDDQVDEGLQRLVRAQRESEPVEEDRPAETGDIVVIDFEGWVDGEKKPEMAATDYELELGSGTTVPGFEDQLTGARTGEHRTLNVTFPEDYRVEELKGRQAVFEVDVKALKRPRTPEVDDAFAQRFGAQTVDELKYRIRERIAADFQQVARQKLKRRLLDALAERYTFPVPPGMVDLEFETIWKQLQEELKQNPDAEGRKSEEELRGEYQSIAERRVRLGLLLSEVGRRNNIEVGQDELGRAVFEEARKYPSQEQQVLEFFRSKPRAVEQLRAPIFEEKVVDYILELAEVTDKPVTVEELMQEPDGEASAA